MLFNRVHIRHGLEYAHDHPGLQLGSLLVVMSSFPPKITRKPTGSHSLPRQIHLGLPFTSNHWNDDSDIGVNYCVFQWKRIRGFTVTGSELMGFTLSHQSAIWAISYLYVYPIISYQITLNYSI